MAKICSSHGETNTCIILLPHTEINHNFQIQNLNFFNSFFAAAAEVRDLGSLSSWSHEMPYALPVSRTSKLNSSIAGQTASREGWLRAYSPAWSRCECALYTIAARQ